MTANPAEETVFRMALSMMAADPASVLTPDQRAWICTRVQVVDAQGREVCFRREERAKLLPPMLAWADAMHPRVGATLRDILGEEMTEHHRTLLRTGAARGPHQETHEPSHPPTTTRS